MTEETKGKLVEHFHRAKERMRDKLIDLSIWALVALMSFLLFEPLQELGRAIFNSPEKIEALIHANDVRSVHVNEALDDLDENIQLIRRDIEDLKRPTRIFSTAQSSGAADGFCLIGQNCEIAVIVRRLPDAIHCEIIPNSSTFRFYSENLLYRYATELTSPSGAKNISEDWTDISLEVRTPSLLDPGPVYFTITPTYHKCNGPNDIAEVAQESAFIPIEAKTAEDQE